MIKVNDLKKEFDGFYALNGINLHVERGSVYALVGPNGAGKSTLIRILTGLYKQSSGQIMIDGQQVYDNAELKKRIAYIPDDLYFFYGATILDIKQMYDAIREDISAGRLSTCFALSGKESEGTASGLKEKYKVSLQYLKGGTVVGERGVVAENIGECYFNENCTSIMEVYRKLRNNI